mgnify:FL=1
MKKYVKECSCCGRTLPTNNFFEIKETMFPDDLVPICIECLNKKIAQSDDSFNTIDRILQYMSIPFIPDKWLELKNSYKNQALEVYVKMYKANKFPYLDWDSAYRNFKELEEENRLEEGIGQYSTAQLNKLRNKWGEEYTNEKDLYYLEKLYQGILDTYSVYGENSLDQVRKLCKIALLIDEKIRAGEDFDKLTRSYDNFAKAANLIPKNIKNANDFSSMGEVFAYLEKNHKWLNRFYDGVKRDIVDKSMEDIQNWCRNFYLNESAIPEDIQARIEALKIADEMEEKLNQIDDDGTEDMDFEEDINEEFNPEAGVDKWR